MGVPADDLGDALPGPAALPVDVDLAHVGRVEDQLDLPAGEERVHGVDVSLQGNGGRLADQPDLAPGEREPQSPLVREGLRPGRVPPGPGGFPGPGVDPGVVDSADPGLEQPVELLQGRDLAAGRVRVVAGDLDHELLLDRFYDALHFSPAHRASRLTVGKLHAEHGAGPPQ